MGHQFDQYVKDNQGKEIFFFEMNCSDINTTLSKGYYDGNLFYYCYFGAPSECDFDNECKIESLCDTVYGPILSDSRYFICDKDELLDFFKDNTYE